MCGVGSGLRGALEARRARQGRAELPTADLHRPRAPAAAARPPLVWEGRAPPIRCEVTMPVALSPADIATGIQSAWAAYLTQRQRPMAPHPYVYASAWRSCDRRILLDLTSSDTLPPWSAEVLARFRRGDDRERDLLADLSRVGRDANPPFKVVGQQQRFELRDRKSRVAIVGKVDAQLEVEGTRAPIEVKAWLPQLVDRIEKFADLFDNPWTRAGGYQLLSYLYGAGEPFGF